MVHWGHNMQLELTPQAVQYIRQILGQRPHDEVNGLIVAIERQLRDEISPKPAPVGDVVVLGNAK